MCQVRRRTVKIRAQMLKQFFLKKQAKKRKNNKSKTKLNQIQITEDKDQNTLHGRKEAKKQSREK